MKILKIACFSKLLCFAIAIVLKIEKKLQAFNDLVKKSNFLKCPFISSVKID